LVRFPPNKKVEDMTDFNSFNLGKEGVSVSVKPWKGELEPFAELEEVWIQLRRIPPKWCDWMVFDQFSSCYGLLEDIDWQKIFSGFYEIVRMKIKCRDASKIHSERLFCLDKKLYKIAITVEGPIFTDGGGENKGGDDEEGGNGHDKGEFDNVDDLDDPKDD
jgi:hypothetical protein